MSGTVETGRELARGIIDKTSQINPKGMVGTVIELLGKCGKAYGTTVGDSFEKNITDVLDETVSDKRASKALLSSTGSFLVNGGLALWNLMSFAEDLRRIKRKVTMTGSLFTADTQNNDLAKLSGITAATAVLPAAAKFPTLSSRTLDRIDPTPGNGLSKWFSKQARGLGRITGTVCSAPLMALGGLGGRANRKLGNVMGKHYIYMHAGTLAHMPLKELWVNIPNGKSTWQAMGLNGNRAFYENDPTVVNRWTNLRSAKMLDEITKEFQANLQRMKGGTTA